MLNINPSTLTAAAPLARHSALAMKDSIPRISARWCDLEDAPADLASGRVLMTKTYTHPDLLPPFVHRPTITLFRDGMAQRVTGPVAPRELGRTDEERERFTKWRAQATESEQKRIDEAKAAKSALHRYFTKRKAEKDAQEEAKYVRACDRAARLGKPIPERPEPKPLAADWKTFCPDKELVQAVRTAERGRTVEERLARYVHKRGLVAGRRTESFNEIFNNADGSRHNALRSTLGIVALELFNSSLPKFNTVYGNDKTVVMEAGKTGIGRLWVRDSEYIETDPARRTCFVIDLDGWWRDIDALWLALRELLPPEYMPNIVTYRGCVTRGGVENPHLLFMLPPTARIGLAYSAAAKKQVRLHGMIQKGIVAHLIDLGADPDHHNVRKTKNPLSPKWSISTNDDHFATMDEWRAMLPTITPNMRAMRNRAKIVRAAREGKDPNDVTLSCALFNDGITARRLLIRTAQATKDAAFLAAVATSHAAFVAWMYHPVTGVVSRRMHALHPDSTAVVDSILQAQREFVVELQLTPTRCGRMANRGRFSDVIAADRNIPTCAPNATKDERKTRATALKSAGGTLARQAVRDVHCGLIAEEVERRLASGATIDEVTEDKGDVVKALVAAGTVKRSTAYNLIDEVISIVQQSARYQARLSDLKLEDPSSIPAEHGESVPMEVSVNPESSSTNPETVKPAKSDFRDRSAAEKMTVERYRLRKSHLIRLRWQQALDDHRRSSQKTLQAVEEVFALDPDDWMTDLLQNLGERSSSQYASPR